MRRVFQLAALVLLALWLPTTVHCDLEALLDPQSTACCGEHGGDANAPVDHCTVEDGGYRIADASVTVAAPDLLVCWCGVELRPMVAADVPVLLDARAEPPPELARTWQFIARAALPVRAPSRVS